jgi:N-carbamoyl-L-amino-acid hydrolase
MTEVLQHAGREAQLALIRAHPELAGKAMVSKTLTAESTNEQTKAGLTDCTPEEYAHIQQLNADYNAKFGWPFILAVRGPRGLGLSKAQIIATFERRLHGHPDFELAECLRNIHRIVEIRLNDKFGVEPTQGNQVWDWQEKLSIHSDPGFAEHGQLTVTYLTDAHRACAQRITQNMRDCGFDEVFTDAVGNAIDAIFPPTVEGHIAQGSPNVFTNRRNAARAVADGADNLVACDRHGPPQYLAQGSSNVFINGVPAHRQFEMATFSAM